MAKKLKSPRFSRQLFKKKSINNSNHIDADDQSTTSSLNSDLPRSHGPIDVDACTSGNKHSSKTRQMFNGGSRRRSRSKSNEQKSRNTLSKIVESRNNSPTQSSTSSSSSKQQHDENIDGSNHSKKSIDTDCHGKDVFERSRCDMSHMLSSTSRAAGGRGGEKNNTSSPTTTSSQSHRTDSPNGSTDTPNGEETSASSSNGSSNNSSPSNSNNNARLSMSPFSLQLSNFPLFGNRTSSLVSPRSAARDATARKEEEDDQQKKQSDNTPGDTCQQKEPSPTSVLQLIVDESSGSSILPAYPVEFNTALSNGGDNNNDGDDNSSGRYSITEYKGDKYDTDSALPLSLSPTKSSIISPKRSSPSSSSASSSMSKVFNKFWEGATSGNYTSLEDAIDTHHESLLSAPPTPPEEDTTMKKDKEEAAAVTTAMELVKSNKDFLSLKKDTEKNEFINNKNVQSFSQQRSSSTPIRVVLPPSTKDTTAITASGSNSMGSSQLLHECKKNKNKLWTLGMGMRRSSSLTNNTNRRPSDFEDTTSSMTTNLLDGTGASSSRSRSSSPSINIPDSTQMGEPASPNAFPQDILVSSPRGSSSQGQQQVTTETNSNKNVTVDNIVESFSFDNQDFLNDMGLGAFPTSAAGVQQQQNNPNIDLDSLSSEEESYLSNEIEDIDSITICEETERMINEHKAYVDSVKNNSCHPSRSIPSIMKVSLATAGSVECSIQTEPEAGGESNKEEQTRIKTSRLTWYDDEENWTKPFTLRTDESFDASTMTSGRYSSTNNKSTAIVGVNQWMDGIMKGMICGGEEDVESYDVGSEQQEI